MRASSGLSALLCLSLILSRKENPEAEDCSFLLCELNFLKHYLNTCHWLETQFLLGEVRVLPPSQLPSVVLWF